VTDELLHYGTPRHSGRYPWGSGQDPEQHSRSLLGHVDALRKQGVSESDIAKGLGMSTTQLRAERSIASNIAKKADVATALRLHEKGMSNVEIGKRMGIRESSVRGLLNAPLSDNKNILQTTAAKLKSQISEDRYLDIGAGTENQLGISSTRLATAVAILKAEGYEVRTVQTPRLDSSGNKTTVKFLVPPGTPKFVDTTKIKTVDSYSEDGGRTQISIKPPVNIDPKRVGIRYAEQGGANADGVIYLRPGVPDISLGKARYAQVRIAVDGTHYLKGMAMYKDDLPAGTDLLFNTNKHDTGNKLDALKGQKEDAENPFGAITRQKTYIDPTTGETKQSPINIVNEEGDWKDWSSSLSSQVLSKQSTALASRQLGLSLASRRDELDEINKLTNPVVKRKLLDAYADGADSASVHLKAAALPKQGTHVILPVETLKENEIYAPNYKNGEKVALIRFPHGGTFEIPEVTVNNKHADARALLGAPGRDKDGNAVGGPIDAIGIHPKVAARLSGADFDGDTVLVIPNNRGEVKSTPPLKKLANFDPSEAYAPYDGMKTIDGGVYHADTKTVEYKNPDGTDKRPSGKQKQTAMGDVSNLITDMTIKGADPDELAAAVRHSMVVIDAEKHHLNYKQSYIDNGIASLKEKYQGRGATGRLAGASTLISKSGTNSKISVPERKLRTAAKGGPIDPITGEHVYEETGVSYVDSKTGKTVVKRSEVTRLGNVSDAHELSSGMPIENIYADYSNSLKALSNAARKASLTTGKLVYSPTAAKTYASQVARLNGALNTALKNKPKERQAQLVANAIVAAKIADNPSIENADLKKIKGQALMTARERVGASKEQIEISPDEWEAIQAGAISDNKLSDILDNADIDKVKELATPRAAHEMTESKIALAKARLASGYTQAEVAESLGVPVSTLNSAIKREGG
jgi:hypothetical protein